VIWRIFEFAREDCFRSDLKLEITFQRESGEGSIHVMKSPDFAEIAFCAQSTSKLLMN
jgi:hypothetical protein